MDYLLKTPRYWLARAEEVTTIAESTKDKIIKEMLLSVAATYNRLAIHAQERVDREEKL